MYKLSYTIGWTSDTDRWFIFDPAVTLTPPDAPRRPIELSDEEGQAIVREVRDHLARHGYRAEAGILD